MIAGGEMMHGISVFLLVALVPTGLTLWFLRRHRPTAPSSDPLDP